MLQSTASLWDEFVAGEYEESGSTDDENSGYDDDEVVETPVYDRGDEEDEPELKSSRR